MKLGQIILQKKMISKNQLVQALGEQQRINEKSKRQFKLGEILMFFGWINLPQLQNFLKEQQPNRDHERQELLKYKKSSPQASL